MKNPKTYSFLKFKGTQLWIKKPQHFGQYVISFEIVCKNKDSKFSLPIFNLFVLP